MGGMGLNPTPEPQAQDAPRFRAWRRAAGPPRMVPGSPLDLSAFAPRAFDQGFSSACGSFAASIVGSAIFNARSDGQVAFDPWWAYHLANAGRDDGVNLRDLGRALESSGLLPMPAGARALSDAEALPGLLTADGWRPEHRIRAEAYTLREARYLGTHEASRAEAWELIHGALDYGFPVVLGIVISEGFRQVDARGFPGRHGLPCGGHALPVIGRVLFEGLDDPRALLVRNSWGVSWGLAGDAFLSRDHVTESAWVEGLVFVSVESPGEPPHPLYSR